MNNSDEQEDAKIREKHWNMALQYYIDCLFKTNYLEKDTYTRIHLDDIFKILRKNKNFINCNPSKSDYNKIVNNQYAKKIIAGYENEPLFKKGELVNVSRHYNWSKKMYHNPSDAISHKPCIVLDYNHVRIMRATEKNKVYKLLCLENYSFWTIEEKHIIRGL